MAHDVFISHSTKDKPTSDAVCARLESSDIRCFVAPRDVLPGLNWGEALIDAINGSKIMVLVFSSHANESRQIIREVERAVNRGVAIIPFRIEDVPPSKPLEYYLSTQHGFNAHPPPLEPHLDRLVVAVRELLAHLRANAPEAEAMPQGNHAEGDASRPGKSRKLENARASNLGQFVSRTCNRWKHVNAFDAAFRTSCQRQVGRPQLYVVHGDEGEAHDSFVERLIATRIRHFAAEIGGEERGTVLNLRIPWPEEGETELRRRDLTISLFREVAPRYMGDDLSASALARLRAAALCPITVIQHDLSASRWDTATDELVSWYVNSFWGALQASGSAQLFLIFLKVVYAPKPSGFRLIPWKLRGPPDKRAIQNRLTSIMRPKSAVCDAQMLPELGSVSIDDVKSWFGQNGIYESETRRRELAEAIFQRSAARRMAEVEHALEEIHREFVREVCTRQGSAAW